eukprot:3542112-Amphidinium_carterae.1
MDTHLGRRVRLGGPEGPTWGRLEKGWMPGTRPSGAAANQCSTAAAGTGCADHLPVGPPCRTH